jgi:hypothetical protein
MKPNPLLLVVPLALASFAFSTMASQQPSWRQSQKTDAAAGTTNTRFTLAGKFLKSPQGDVSNNRPALVLDCAPGRGSHPHKGRLLVGNLLVGTALKIIYVEPEEIHGTSYFQKISVRYRLDGAKEETEKWSPGTEKASASIPGGSLKKILRGHSLEITAEDDHGLPVVMQFDMPDPGPVEAACGVD